MITVLLIAALCDVNGCTYMDVTDKFRFRGDDECAQLANFLNSENRSRSLDPRFACLTPSKYKELATLGL